MKKEVLDTESALKKGQTKPWCVIYELSKLYAGKVPENMTLDEEITEVRFFDQLEEIRIFQTSAGWKAASVSSDGKNTIEKTYPVRNREYGKKITVSRDLATDEDGQTYVAAVRLSGWEGQ